MMKIYFAGSIRGGRQDQSTYYKIIEYLNECGQVLTEHVGNQNVIKDETKYSDVNIYERDIQWINESDVLIAEVTSPSLGVGYEISFAENKNIPILCLFNQNSNFILSAMLSGNKKLITKKYSNFQEAKEIIDIFLKNI